VSGIEDTLRQVMAGHDQEAPTAADLLRDQALRAAQIAETIEELRG